MDREKASQRLERLWTGMLLTISTISTLDWAWIHSRRFWPRPKELLYPVPNLVKSLQTLHR